MCKAVKLTPMMQRLFAGAYFFGGFHLSTQNGHFPLDDRPALPTFGAPSLTYCNTRLTHLKAPPMMTIYLVQGQNALTGTSEYRIRLPAQNSHHYRVSQVLQ